MQVNSKQNTEADTVNAKFVNDMRTYPVYETIFHESITRIDRSTTSDQLQKHNPKGENIRLLSKFATRGILRCKIAERVMGKVEKKKTTKDSTLVMHSFHQNL